MFLWRIRFLDVCGQARGPVPTTDGARGYGMSPFSPFRLFAFSPFRLFAFSPFRLSPFRLSPFRLSPFASCIFRARFN